MPGVDGQEDEDDGEGDDGDENGDEDDDADDEDDLIQGLSRKARSPRNEVSEEYERRLGLSEEEKRGLWAMSVNLDHWEPGGE